MKKLQPKSKGYGRWTLDKNGKPVRDGDKVLLPPSVFDALAMAAEAAGGVRFGALGVLDPRLGNPSGCLVGLANWVGEGVPDELRSALSEVAIMRGIPGLNDAAFDPTEVDDALPFDVLCQRAGIDIDPKAAVLA